MTNKTTVTSIAFASLRFGGSVAARDFRKSVVGKIS